MVVLGKNDSVELAKRTLSPVTPLFSQTTEPVALVQELIQKALMANASDVHLDPGPESWPES